MAAGGDAVILTPCWCFKPCFQDAVDVSSEHTVVFVFGAMRIRFVVLGYFL